MITFPLLALLAIASELAIIGTDGKAPDYWKNAAVLYAEVKEIDQLDGELPTHQRVRMRPLAVFTGTFDAALRSEVTINLVVGHSMLSNIPEAPSKGAKVVVLVMQNHDGRFSTLNGGVRFFPLNNGARTAIFEVSGLGDSKVGELTKLLNQLRGNKLEGKLSERLQRSMPRVGLIPFAFGKSPEFWKDAAVIYAEVNETGSNEDQTFELQPITVLTGNFDAALQGKITVQVNGGSKLPAKGANVVVLVQRDKGKFFLPSSVAFFGEISTNCPALWEVNDFNDPTVGKIMDVLRTIRAPQPYVEPIDHAYR